MHNPARPTEQEIAVLSALRALARSRLAAPPADAVALAARRGWITRASSRDQWRLTAAGREALRRGRASPCEGATTAGGRQARSGSESPLAWLHARRDRRGRRLVSHAQLEAGERFQADFWHAQMGPRVTSSWSPTPPAHGAPQGSPGVGVEMAESVVAARQRVAAALKAVGPELSGIIVDVCGLQLGVEAIEQRLGWPQRSGKIVLGLALDRLARHYGIIAPARGGGQDGAIRHWGAGDYRPTLDEWR